MTFASAVYLIRPKRFGYDPETAASNSFQKRSSLPDDEVRRLAKEEFDGVADGLDRAGITVVIGEDESRPETPDAVFPNNWFSTHPDGTLCLYPMEAISRRLERSAGHVEKVIGVCGTTKIVDLTGYESEGRYLEGTGSLVIDHDSRTVFACVSSRTDPGLVAEWADITGHEAVIFNAFGPGGGRVYHTNVVMCIGVDSAVICADAVSDDADRKRLIGALEAGAKEPIFITVQQMSRFAGNLIQLKAMDGTPVMAMSESAREALGPVALGVIERRSAVVSVPIPVIEHCSGGSVRCMVAELFGKSK